MNYLALHIIFHFTFVHAIAQKCVLDMLLWNQSNGVEGTWGGFLTNPSCRSPFERYLYALSERTNKTGQIFLNITDQKHCISTSYKDVKDCGVEMRLSSGNGGCSDYSVTDVINKLGSDLEGLNESCQDLGSKNEECNSCLRRWEKINDEVCRFTVMVTLTSRRIYDTEWIMSMFACLGNGIPVDDQAGAGHNINFTTGLEVLVGGVGGVSVIVAIIWMVMFKKTSTVSVRKPPKRIDDNDDSISEESSSVNISLKQVYLATDNLCASNFIGQGVAGKVYKGVLSDGRRIAVKHIINDGQMETFVREVTSLSHVKHPNLVALLGHCDGDDESFLVYELCDNGNLSEWLFSKHKVLTWIQRLEIAIDCARGLWFLHTYPEGCIVHRDIKPTNILLGTNFQAKLSDFGLSKVISMGLSYVSSEVRGTFGYVDPEYQKNRHVHSSTDVYSFGIVLLQLLSGQRVINMDVSRPMPLSRMAKNLVKGGDITDFADQKLNREYSVEAFQLVFKLALSCAGLKQQRPSMEKVVSVLEKAHQISDRVKCFESSFQSV